jgi:tripartite ATP-independent transporter DctM subunit
VIALLFASFILLLLVGVDVGFAMVAAAWIGIELHGGRGVDAVLLPSSMLSYVSLYALVQIPLFILAGELMNRGGITGRLIDWSRALVSGRRGALGHVGIVSNLMVSGISGSAIADAIATGKPLIPAMQRSGYGRSYPAAVIAAGAMLGPVIPPSIPMVVYAQMANESVARMFFSGILPGLLLAAGFFVICTIEARRRGLPADERASWRERGRQTVRAVWAIGMPAMILLGIRFGLVTDTEIAAVAVLYGFLVSRFIYRDLTLAAIPPLLVSAARSSAVILFLLAAAGPFSWLVAESGVSTAIVGMIRGITTDPTMTLLIVNAVMLVVGILMEPLPAMVIFVPALLPIATDLGIDGVQFGALIVINLMVGLITPPIGLLLFVVGGIGDVKFGQVARDVLPFLGWSIVVLVLIAVWPPLTLWLAGHV